jgi:hypothetical protein
VIADGAGHTFFEEGPPMWTTANRPRDKRDKLRHPSDLTGEEWAHIEALIPPAKHGGRKRARMCEWAKQALQAKIAEVMYVLRTGFADQSEAPTHPSLARAWAKRRRPGR